MTARSLLTRATWLFVCGFLPLVSLFYALKPLAGPSHVVDFHFNYYYAAEAIRAGQDFYPTGDFVVRGSDDLIIDYVYPPLVAIVTVPWTLLPVGLAETIFQFVLVAALVGTLAVLGVRDWRCYGLAFLWPPVTDAISTGNITILLGLAAALSWRYRERSLAAGASVGISIAMKIFLWPLTIWLAATRRATAASWSVGIGLVALFASWAVVGFRGFTEYPDLVRRLSERMDERGYTVYALGVDVGLAPGLARALWLALAVGSLLAAVILARRGDDQRSYVLALTAAIAFSPIVWLHYLALLLVIVAVAQPQLGPMWFIGLPLQVFVTTGVYNGSTLQTVAVLTAAAVTVALALRSSPLERGRMTVSSPAAR